MCVGILGRCEQIQSAEDVLPEESLPQIPWTSWNYMQTFRHKYVQFFMNEGSLSLDLQKGLRSHSNYKVLHKWGSLENVVLEPCVARQDLSEARCWRTGHTKDSKVNRQPWISPRRRRRGGQRALGTWWRLREEGRETRSWCSDSPRVSWVSSH